MRSWIMSSTVFISTTVGCLYPSNAALHEDAVIGAGIDADIDASIWDVLFCMLPWSQTRLSFFFGIGISKGCCEERCFKDKYASRSRFICVSPDCVVCSMLQQCISELAEYIIFSFWSHTVIDYRSGTRTIKEKRANSLLVISNILRSFLKAKRICRISWPLLATQSRAETRASLSTASTATATDILRFTHQASENVLFALPQRQHAKTPTSMRATVKSDRTSVCVRMSRILYVRLIATWLLFQKNRSHPRLTIRIWNIEWTCLPWNVNYSQHIRLRTSLSSECP